MVPGTYLLIAQRKEKIVRLTAEDIKIFNKLKGRDPTGYPLAGYLPFPFALFLLEVDNQRDNSKEIKDGSTTDG